MAGKIQDMLLGRKMLVSEDEKNGVHINIIVGEKMSCVVVKNTIL